MQSLNKFIIEKLKLNKESQLFKKEMNLNDLLSYVYINYKVTKDSFLQILRGINFWSKDIKIDNHNFKFVNITKEDLRQNTKSTRYKDIFNKLLDNSINLNKHTTDTWQLSSIRHLHLQIYLSCIFEEDFCIKKQFNMEYYLYIINTSNRKGEVFYIIK